MRIVFSVLLGAHGLLHLAGFLKAYGLVELSQLQSIDRLRGLCWLAAAVLYSLGASLLAVSVSLWWLPASAGLFVSQAAILSSWNDAKYGTVGNVVLTIPLIWIALNARAGSLPSMYQREVLAQLARTVPEARVSETDLAPLPELMQSYLRRVGAVGKPRVQNFQARWAVQIRPSRDADWMSGQVEQYNFVTPPARLFLMDASRFGIPFHAFHRYVGDEATMQVRVLSVVDVVNARGPEMNQGETVTLFNDLCLLAPAALLDASVRWQDVGPRRLRGWFSNAGNTISAELVFDQEGDLVNFVSDDRFESSDGRTYLRHTWSTPVSAYRDFDGRRVPTLGEAVWSDAHGDFTYLRFRLSEIEYNVH